MEPYRYVVLTIKEADWVRMEAEGVLGEEINKLTLRGFERLGLLVPSDRREYNKHVHGWEAPRLHDLKRWMVGIVKTGGDCSPYGERVGEIVWGECSKGHDHKKMVGMGELSEADVDARILASLEHIEAKLVGMGGAKRAKPKPGDRDPNDSTRVWARFQQRRHPMCDEVVMRMPGEHPRYSPDRRMETSPSTGFHGVAIEDIPSGSAVMFAVPQVYGYSELGFMVRLVDGTVRGPERLGVVEHGVRRGERAFILTHGLVYGKCSAAV